MEMQFDTARLFERFRDMGPRLELFGEAVAAEFGAQVRDEVIAKATSLLSTRTAPKFLAGLGPVEVEREGDDFVARIELEDGLPTWIEKGVGPFLIPPSDRAVPFFHWPRSQWRRRQKHGGTIINPKALRELLNLPTTVQGQTASGGRAGFDARPKEFWHGRNAQLRKGIVNRRRAHHKTDIPAGMYRLKDPEDIAEPGPLGVTFRQHARPWRHPGIKAHRFFPTAIRRVQNRGQEIIARFWREIMS